MIFDINTDKTLFDEFVKNHPTKSHFMQSVAWGELCEKTKAQKPYHISLKDDYGNIKAAALVLVCKPRFFPSFLYCPRGFVMDFEDTELLNEFVKNIYEFAKTKRAMSLTIDPDIERWDIGKDGKPKDKKAKQTPVHENLLSLGFIHSGYNLGFENKLPRFTFRIDLEKEESEIKKAVSKSAMKDIKKGEAYPSTVSISQGNNGDDFYRLMQKTGTRDKFFCYSNEYYKSFYEVLSKHGMAKMFIGSVYPKEIVKMLAKKLEQTTQSLENEDKPDVAAALLATKNRLEREFLKYRQRLQNYPESYVAAAQIVVEYGGHTWAVHGGSDDEFFETFINKRVYIEKILDSKRSGNVWFDQFGTIGDPENHKLKQLHKFKQNFGGRYIEFIGEYDLPINKMAYFLFKKSLPLYRAFRFKTKGLFQKIGGK